MKLCVFGGGAIGGHVAGHLARASLCDVSLVARGANLEAIQARGITVRTEAETFTHPVRATEDTRELGVQDYVLLTCKANDLDSALDQLRPLIGPDTTVLPPTTGLPHYYFHGLDGTAPARATAALDPGGRIASVIPPEQSLGIAYWIGAHSIAPGVVAQDGARAGAPVGELDGSASDRVVRLARLLSASGIHSRVRDNIRGDIWVKFVNSLCWNPVAVLTLAAMGEIGASPDLVATVRAMMEEADAIAAALGVTLPYPPAKRIETTLAAPGHRMSMLQAFEARRPLELDVLLASIRAAAGATDLPTPRIEAVYALARLRAGLAYRPETEHA